VGERILVVDDDQYNRELLNAVLSEDRYQLLHAGTEWPPSPIERALSSLTEGTNVVVEYDRSMVHLGAPAESPDVKGGHQLLKALRKKSKGFTLIELLVVVAIIGLLATIVIPSLLSAQKKSKYARAASDTKTAVTQAIVFSYDKNQNPGDMKTLRDNSYATIADNDPWNTGWVYSTAFATTTQPAASGEMATCSKGPAASGACTFPVMTPDTGIDGSVGYSSIYGSWQGKAN
jgi:general secretion pathway protein G